MERSLKVQINHTLASTKTDVHKQEPLEQMDGELVCSFFLVGVGFALRVSPSTCDSPAGSEDIVDVLHR
eukprot:scaffold12195_cov126-Cylindrotheca_fusiformis.AAC.7